jgi:F-type H+-transporting ATPase subunit alpha
MKQVAGQLKGDLAQFRELAAFAQFGSDLDPKTQAQIDRGRRITEIFKQPQYNPVSVEVQVAVLWAVQKGYLDLVPVEQVKEYQGQLSEFLTTRKTQLLARIAKEKTINDTLAADLKSASDEFNQNWQAAHPQAAKAKSEKPLQPALGKAP